MVEAGKRALLGEWCGLRVITLFSHETCIRKVKGNRDVVYHVHRRYVVHSLIFKASQSLKPGKDEASTFVIQTAHFFGSPGNWNLRPRPPWYVCPAGAALPLSALIKFPSLRSLELVDRAVGHSLVSSGI